MNMWVSQTNNASTKYKKNPNMQKNVKTYGMTSAISLAEPKPSDIKRTNELKEALKPFNVFESEEEMNHRMEILSKLNVLVKQWVREISVAKKMSPKSTDEAGGKIYTFGSYRLGVHNRGADIDVLCVVPRHIQRCDYFTSFFELLKTQAEVTELRAVEQAFVPVIKMNFDGIEIDMLFARLALKEIPDSMDLQDDMLLKNLDEKCVRSLNGCRVTDEILRLVPDIENFRLVLRAIKLWAKKKRIYSNALGYLGGVSWAMLVARTCQLYPNAAASTLIEKFFLVFSQWKWPQPVLLQSPKKANLRFPVWDPRVNLKDREHLMPIITPAYPQQNSTCNVSVSTRTIIQEAFEAGLAVTAEIILGKASWEKLFEPPNFFGKYRHFIALLASSRTREDHLEWCGFIEAKTRHLIGLLERNPNVTLAHINTESYTPKDIQQGKHTSMWFIGLTFRKGENLNVVLTDEIRAFVRKTEWEAEQICLLKQGMDIDVKYVKRKDLSIYLDANILSKEDKVSSGTQALRKRKLEQSLNNNNDKKRKVQGSEQQQKQPSSKQEDSKKDTRKNSHNGGRHPESDKENIGTVAA